MLRSVLLLSSIMMVSPAGAVDLTADAPQAGDITVWGRDLDLLGLAKSGSEGVVGYRDFRDRPLLRVGELVETVPGVIATQHSGTGKANQYFLRGFNLDHGTDFAGFVDGAPVNQRSHGHGQGYLDFNFIIPELIERVDYRKGPYFSDVGDFSAAGTVSFTTYDRLERPFAELTAGSYGYWRGVAAGSTPLAGGDLLVGLEGTASNGPWVLDENLERLNALVKFGRTNGDNRWSLAFSAYDARWTSTDQVPSRAVASGLIERRGFIDPDLGGHASRYALTAKADIGATEINAYAVRTRLRLTSNFTYFLDDPVDGDQFQQRDRRTTLGGAIRHAWPTRLGALPLTLRIGGDVRYDDIPTIGLYRSRAGQVTGTVREDDVAQHGAGLYAEAEMALTPTLRLVAGVRGDHLGYDVDAALPDNSGKGSSTMLTPKFALAWRAAPQVELYANYGESFHSNDARGAETRINPVDGSPATPVDLMVRAKGAEIGARVDTGRFNATLVGFWLDLGSELVFVGDAGTTEPNDATRRHGVEFSAFWRPVDGLTLDASAAWTRARFRGVPSGLRAIPGAVRSVVAAGAVAEIGAGFRASARLRHFGSAPLIEDGSVRSQPTTLVNLGLYRDMGRLRIGLDLYNAFNARDADISYYYASRLSGEAAAQEDLHSHPVEPRQLRATIRLAW